MMKILEIVRRFWKYLFAKLRKCSQLLYLEEIGPWPLFHEKYELQHRMEDDGDVWTEGSESESDADTHIKSSGTWRTTAASVEGVQTENSLESANYSSDSSVNLITQWCEHEYASPSSMYSSTVMSTHQEHGVLIGKSRNGLIVGRWEIQIVDTTTSGNEKFLN